MASVHGSTSRPRLPQQVPVGAEDVVREEDATLGNTSTFAQSQLGARAGGLLPPEDLERPVRELGLFHPPPRALRGLSCGVGSAGVEVVEARAPNKAPLGTARTAVFVSSVALR